MRHDELMLNKKESPPNALGVLHYFVIRKFFMVSSLHRLVRLIIQNVPGKIKRGKIHRKGVGKMFEMIRRWQGQGNASVTGGVAQAARLQTRSYV